MPRVKCGASHCALVTGRASLRLAILLRDKHDTPSAVRASYPSHS